MQVTRNIASNTQGQFFAISTFGDGSVDEAGPFTSSDAAAAAIAEQEEIDAAIDDAEGQAWADDMSQLRWAEAGGYAAGLARPGRSYPRTDGTRTASSGIDWSDEIPF